MKELGLREFLKDCEKLVIIGIGNEMKGDDGVGIYIVKEIAKRFGKYGNDEVIKINEYIILLNCGTVPENFTDVLKRENPSHIIMIDAALMNEKIGEIKVINPEDIVNVGFSTHALPLSIIIKYIKKSINTKIIVIGIEPKIIDFDKPLSNEIKHRADNFIEYLVKIINTIFVRC
ncbi:hydrogenase maturation peptidase HycI [Methanotorris formicicus]|uniref:Hydrogenase maturation protease HycI n=1 Tax=Methanotorris formicicus Mc-S-70 TaxID=647171 RepID=H1L0S6_9EURY|nr:hydrogenase maturation peptidase HycI [Methanotorris formicicus]EHP84476.1 hydrogenase maturation protease HycI [Methanotorris formicicus Mc-S-70]